MKIDDFYAKKYAAGGVSTVATTPRGPADAAVCPGSLVLPRTTGDPLHCILEFRRLVSASAPDASDLQHDYSDVLSRLSAEVEPIDRTAWPVPKHLRRSAEQLLVCGVNGKVADFKNALRQNNS